MVYDGSDNYVALTALTPGVTQYYKLAAYDTFFARDYTGTGLNLTGEFSAVPATVDAGIPQYASDPSGVEGDFYYNTTDQHLYQHDGTGWIAVAGDIAANTITGAMIQANTISASNIVADTITANEIASNTITADRMNVSTLSSVTSSTGTLVINTGGYVRGGQTAYNTGTGFYIGNDAGTPKFSIGVQGGAGLTWDGAIFTVGGSMSSMTIVTGGHVKMGQTSFNTGTGFFLGDSAGIPKFSIGNSAGNNLTWDGTTLQVTGNIQKAGITYSTGSTYLYHQNNTTQSMTPWKAGVNETVEKTFVATSTQVYTIDYNLYRSSGTTPCLSEVVYVMIYVDGVLQVQQSTNSTTAVNYSTNIGLVATGSTISLALYRYESAWPPSCAPTAYNSKFEVRGGTEKVIASAPGDTIVYGTTYYAVKQIKLPYAGTVKTRFQMLNNGASITGRIYKNGTAVGTERVHSATGYSSVYEENFTIAAGDILQLYCKQGTAYLVSDWATMFQILSLTTNTAEYPEIY